MDYEDNKAEGMSDAAKLGILAGALGLTGLIAWAYSDKGPLSAKKTASGASRTYLAGGGETATSMAAKYNAVGHENDIISANPSLNWPLTLGDHVAIPDSWGLLYSTKTSSGAYRTYRAVGGETVAALAAQLNHLGHEYDLATANPNLTWPLTVGEIVIIPHQWDLPAGWPNHPGGWPNTSGGGHYMDWHAHSQRPDFAGWASEHASGASGKSPEYQHGYQVGVAAAKLAPNSPVTANVSTKNGGANLWNGTSWVNTSTDFQQGWHAGVLKGHHQHATATASQSR
jgi:hypothetical protein